MSVLTFPIAAMQLQEVKGPAFACYALRTVEADIGVLACKNSCRPAALPRIENSSQG